jgi:hypothetical protein
LVETTNFNELGVSQGDMVRDGVAADRRFRMNEVDYTDRGLEPTETRNDVTATLISSLARLAEVSTFEEKSLEYDNLS